MDDGDLLLKAIHANLEDDTPRLVYADWLDEQGRHERAEFIRVQVSLAQQGYPGPLTLRAATLDAASQYPATPGAPSSQATRCATILHRFAPVWLGDAFFSRPIGEVREWGWSRGFLHSLPVRLSDVFTRRAGGFDREGPDAGVDWSNRNGFPCCCHWASSLHGDTCPEHDKRGTVIPEWHPTAWARDTLRDFPTIQRMPLTDRSVGNEYVFSWLRDDTLGEAYSLPTNLFDACYSPHRHKQRDGIWLYFIDQATAHDALAEAVVKVIKEQTV